MAKVFRIPRPTLAAIVVISLVSLPAGATAQPALPNLPSAIMCYAQADQSWRVGYLSRVDKSGDALYVTADRRLSVTVNAKGIVATPTNRPPVTDCYGKTLDELRSSGRLIESQRAK